MVDRGRRLHLRISEELLRGLSPQERRQLYNIPDGAKTVGDIIGDLKESRQIRHDFVLAVCGSRVFPQDPVTIFRDNDVVGLKRVHLAKLAKRGRILCECCECKEPAEFSTWQWKRFCAGRTARCSACVGSPGIIPTLAPSSAQAQATARAPGLSSGSNLSAKKIPRIPDSSPGDDAPPSLPPKSTTAGKNARKRERKRRQGDFESGPTKLLQKRSAADLRAWWADRGLLGPNLGVPTEISGSKRRAQFAMAHQGQRWRNKWRPLKNGSVASPPASRRNMQTSNLD